MPRIDAFNIEGGKVETIEARLESGWFLAKTGGSIPSTEQGTGHGHEAGILHRSEGKERRWKHAVGIRHLGTRRG